MQKVFIFVIAIRNTYEVFEPYLYMIVYIDYIIIV